VRTLALIPARSGSTRCPGKNMEHIGGRSLVDRAVDVALRCTNVDEVVVSTDIEELLDREVGPDGVSIDRRPDALCGSTVAIEDVILELIPRLDEPPTHVALLNPTSPLRRRHTVDCAIGHAKRGGWSTVATVAPVLDGLQWDDASVPPWYHRKPRTQDLGIRYEEHASVYVLRVDEIDHWTSYPLPAMAIPTSPLEAVDIDYPEDLTVARALSHLEPKWEPSTEIVEGLWVGTVDVAEERRHVYGWKAVVSLTHLPDFDLEALESELSDVADSIAEAHAKGPVLVACLEGRVRSATAALAYLVKHQGLGLLEAHRLLHRKRACLPMVQVVERWWG
jgi:CMP-N,N'-diacetyllegionaminic acid synthase